MFIQSPLTDGLYIRPIRPERRMIRYFIKYFPHITGGLLSLVVLSSLFFTDWKLTIVLIGGYLMYLISKAQFRKHKKLRAIYSHSSTQVVRVFALMLIVTTLLYYVYRRTDYLNVVRDDVLWLLYLPVISAVSQRGTRRVFFLVLAIAIGCLYFVHPTNGRITWHFIKQDTLDFLTKSFWLILLSLTSYVLLRYMSDAVADLNLIINVQNRMRQMEGGLLRSKVDLNENSFLEKAVEIIKGDLYYNHVNVFRLDKSRQELICMAGACDEGKKLAREGYRVSIADQDSIIGYVTRTEEPYISNNVADDPRYMPHKAFPNTQAELVVPIRVRNRLYGVLDIQVHQPNYFLDQDLKAIEILANHIGWVIDNSEQFSHISWINRIIETIADPIFTQIHFDETLQEIADSALEELKADVVFLYSYDPSMKEVVSGPIYSGMLLHPELLDPASTDPENVVSRLITDAERIYINDDLQTVNLNTHPLFSPSPTHISTKKPTFIEREDIKSNVIIRLLNNGQCVGILFLNFRSPRTFTDWEKKRYFSFAHLAALAIQKMQMQQHVIQKEKNDLSNLIHDILIGDTVGLFKILKSLDLSSEEISHNGSKEKIDLAVEATEHLHNDIRWINRLLKENYSDDLMLELDKLFTLFKNVFNINAKTEWNGDTRLISPVLARELFIVIREALTNAVRHGKAKNIKVIGVIKPNDLKATISDDGVGFDPKQVRRMNGLLSMKYRIEEMGGKFKLVSNPGKGTKIVLTVPVQNSNAGVQ